MVSATGTKNLPSRPCSVRRQEHDDDDQMPAVTGAATFAHRPEHDAGAAACPAVRARCWTMFSTTTTAPTTSMPRRWPDRPGSSGWPTCRPAHQDEGASADSGSTTATVTAARRLPRKAPAAPAPARSPPAAPFDTCRRPFHDQGAAIEDLISTPFRQGGLEFGQLLARLARPFCALAPARPEHQAFHGLALTALRHHAVAREIAPRTWATSATRTHAAALRP